MKKNIKCRIILENSPVGVAFGLQKGKGNAYETLQTQVGNGVDLIFECIAQVKDVTDATPDFLGENIYGTPFNRFIYIDIGASAGQIGSIWQRRLKVPLRDISKEMVQKALKNEGFALETRVNGVGKDGTPNCATVKPFEGWTIR